MPISINQFKSWAATNQDTTVAINGRTQTLEDASNQVGLLDRMFRRGAVKNVRGAVMADFTRALSVRYGVSIARQALSEAGLSETSELTGRTISAVIASAKNIRAGVLAPTATQDLRLGGAVLTPAQIRVYGQA